MNLLASVTNWLSRQYTAHTCTQPDNQLLPHCLIWSPLPQHELTSREQLPQ